MSLLGKFRLLGKSIPSIKPYLPHSFKLISSHFFPKGIDERSWAAIEIAKDGSKNLFPIKMRDPAISNAYNFLKKKDLFPDDDDDDEDECCFGDDDFDM